MTEKTKSGDIATIVFGVLVASGCGLYFTYELARAALFGVVLGSAKRGEPLHDVFRATAPGTFYENVALYAFFDIPLLVIVIGLVAGLIVKVTRKNRP